MYFDGGNFNDHDVHRVLKNRNLHMELAKIMATKITVDDTEITIMTVDEKTSSRSRTCSKPRMEIFSFLTG